MRDEVGLLELRPLGDDQRRIGAAQRVVGHVVVADAVAEDALAPPPAPPGRAPAPRRRPASSASISVTDGASRMSSVRGLNESPHTASAAPAQVARRSGRMTFSNSARFCAALTSSTAPQDARRDVARLRHRDQRLDVLRKARAAVADAGEQKRRADAAVEADAAAHVLDVAAERLAQVGELVDQRDARRQHGVGGVLGHLGALRAHEQDRVAGADEGLVELLHDGAGALAAVSR